MSKPALHKPHEPIASPPADPSVEVASSSAIGEAVSVAAVTSNSSSSSYAPPVDQDVIVVVVVVVVAQGEAVLGDAVGGAVRGSGVG